ncbi:MAG: hypothetical protein E6J91_41495 [Deltaproteobacteria bacterium]|nr:MAG: hypothetical protein E6J91_41495 [Deltaproteobacteria bacterium]
MYNLTTLATSPLDSITPDLLLLVSGGCGGHRRCCCPAPAPVAPVQQCVVNVPPPQGPQFLPQLAQQSAPPPSGPTGDSITTNVSINGRQLA